MLIYSDTASAVDLPFIQAKQTEEGRQMILLTLPYFRSLSFQVIVKKTFSFVFRSIPTYLCCLLVESNIEP